MDKPIAPHILVLQQEPSFRSELAAVLSASGYLVKPTASPAQALAWLTDDAFDLMVVDLDTDHIDGVAFMQNVSKLQPELQMVIMTGKPTLRTAIAAIRAGATDYLVKPIDLSVVIESIDRSLQSLAALKSQLARYVREAGKGGGDSEPVPAPEPDANARPSVIIVPPIRLDYTHRRASLIDDSTQIIDLSRGESTVLACLMSNPNQTLTTSQLARLAWSYELDTIEAGELVRPYIHRLRRKLEQNPNEPSLIITVRGQGYLFISDRRATAADSN